jgi:hypothetical protein
MSYLGGRVDVDAARVRRDRKRAVAQMPLAHPNNAASIMPSAISAGMKIGEVNQTSMPFSECIPAREMRG